jgi:hypothetical protein
LDAACKACCFHEIMYCVFLQGQPLAEVNVTAGIVSMAFDDHQSQDADARNTHLKLRGQKLDLLLEVMQAAIATKVSCFNVKSLSHTSMGLMDSAFKDLFCNVLYKLRCDCSLGV